MNSSLSGPPEFAPDICGRIFTNGCGKNENRSDNPRKSWREANIAFVIATSYLAMITLIAFVMYVRNQTRLRLIVVIFSILGLSSAVIGFLSTTRFRGSFKTDDNSNDKLGSDYFWVVYFVCEGLGTAILAWTVVKVGTVFYSQAGRKNIFYVLSIVIISLFATIATANLVIYLTQLKGNPLKGTQAYQYQICISYMQYCLDLTPGRPDGFDWRKRVLAEWNDDQKNPSREVYLPNQVLTAVTFLWVSMYLFVPLLRNRKHRPVIGSDMTAVGIWYLSCLSILVSVYMALTIWSCFQVNPKILYQPWISAFDVCLRGTIGIVFSLPAPKFIIQFARQYYGHQRKEGDCSRIPRGINSRQHGMFTSNMNCSQDYGGNFSTDRSFVTTLGTTAKAGAPIEDPLGYLENHSNRSNNMNFGSIKLFPTRNRGESMESSKMFSQDFEPEDLQDGNLTGDEGHTSDSFQQYYSKMDTAIPIVMSREPNTLTSQDAQEKGVLSSEHKMGEPQRPAPALTMTRSTEKQAVRSWDIDSQVKPSSENNTSPSSSSQKCTIQQHSRDATSEPKLTPAVAGESALQPSAHAPQEVTSKSTGITGTTGWEIGGWGHLREGSDTSNANPAHPRDGSSASNASLAHPLEKKLYRQDLVYNVGDGTVSVLPELTGLQKQLAQHQSSLLPSAIAIQHYDPAENCPPALRAQMEAAFANYIESLPPDVDIDGRIRLPGQEPDLITADSDDLKMTRHLNERFRVYQQNHNSFAYDRAYWIKHPPNQSNIDSATSRKERLMEDVYLNPIQSAASKLITIQPPPPSFAPPLPPPTATASLKKKWLSGRKSHDLDRLSSQSAAIKLNETDRAPSGGERRGSLTNTGTEGASSKPNKPKESRLGVFSKVLSGTSHKGSDRVRTSQDINDQDRERDKPESGAKTDSKSAGPLQISAPAPATVEALTKSTSLGQLQEEDEDKGLQYYYPDPYFSLAESKKSHSSSSGSAAMEKGISSSSAQKHPLSPTFPGDTRSNSMGSAKSATGAASTLESSNSQTSPFDYCPQSPVLDASKSDTATISSSKSGKGSLGSRKSSKLDLSLPRNAADIAGSAPNTPLPQPGGFGSLLARSSSNSKKLSAKFKARDSRSKSDLAPGRTSADLIQSSVASLPITATRKPSIPSVPISNQPSSLSPPPRQSWSRSKSFQGAAPTISAALTGKFTEGENPMMIDVQLANDLISGDATIPSSGGTRSSMSSSIGSPTTDSPTLTPTSEVRTKTAPPLKKDSLSSPAPSPSTPSIASPFPRLGGMAPPRTSQDKRNNSLDRDSELSFSASGSGGLGASGTGKSRTGFTTATMDLRRASNRPQRSVDNLASAYFYRRAAEYSGSNDVNSRLGGSSNDKAINSGTSASTSHGIPPSSPHLTSSGFSYYGVGIDGGGDSGRSSPRSHRDSLLGQKPHHKSQYSIDYSTGFSSSSPSSPFDNPPAPPGVNDSGRTNSVTSSLHLMADDPWTQAMVARAQNSNPATGATSPATTPTGGATGTGLGGGGSGHSHSFSQSSIQFPVSPTRSPSPGLFAPSSLSTFSSRPGIARTGSE
ncbi:hypothetical protein BG015_001680 [Linnemannia schmuckeri]|uniref:Uncharacterized protein n=1 Tax=Linnemannia schmuckeri TaxID=64567 RepID=A0A9P5S700_9FUNG|nr:hypothetical protein BG015_001680 [Linnemannia schmuckeri]